MVFSLQDSKGGSSAEKQVRQSSPDLGILIYPTKEQLPSKRQVFAGRLFLYFAIVALSEEIVDISRLPLYNLNIVKQLLTPS